MERCRRVVSLVDGSVKEVLARGFELIFAFESIEKAIGRAKIGY